MANLGTKNGVFIARFRFLGKEYKRSLKTADRGHAVAALRRVEDALHWLAIGKLTSQAQRTPQQKQQIGRVVCEPGQ